MKERRSLRKRRQRGSALVEFALASLAFCALLFASADFAITLFARVTLRNALRQGLRTAVTGHTLDGMAHDSSIREVVRQNSFGLIQDGGLAQVEIAYYTPDGASSISNAPGNIAKISLRSYTHTPIGAVLRSNHPIPFALDLVDVVEPYTGAPPPR